MAEYIDKGTAIAKITALEVTEPNATMTSAKRQLADMPASDVAPVVHGRWIRPHWKNNNYCCDCSECGGEAMHRDYQWYKNGVYPICPNCGAKMDGKDGGDNDANKEVD